MEQKTKVLVIEDEPALRDIYSTKLRMEGFEVLEAVDGIEGLDSALQHSPAIILLDVVLPIKDGFEVLKDLKMNSKTKEIPVVILSNLGQDEDITRAKSLGALDFLVKADVSINEVVQRVKEIYVRYLQGIKG